MVTDAFDWALNNESTTMQTNSRDYSGNVLFRVCVYVYECVCVNCF